MSTGVVERFERAGSRVALAEVLGSPARVAGFLWVAVVVAFVYTLLLPFNYTQRFELANWDYLNAYLLAWAIVLGLGMGLVVSVQVHALHKVAVARAAGGAAFVASLLPSFLCCTPIIPSFLAFVGVSGVGLYGTTGTLQHFFAVHQTEFLAASLALLVLTSWWGLRKVARSACLSGKGCAPETPSFVAVSSGAGDPERAEPAADGGGEGQMEKRNSRR